MKSNEKVRFYIGSGHYPDCKVHVVNGSGHGNTAGMRVDLTALIMERFGLDRKGRLSNIKQNSHGVMLGMGERYDKKAFGLSPLEYWHSDVYQKCDYLFEFL